MSTDNRLEMFISLNVEAFKKGLNAAGTSVRTMASGSSTAFKETRTRLQENVVAVKNYNTELGRQGGVLQTLRGHVLGLAGAVGVSVSAIAGLGKLVNVTREFDRLNAGLITATGSAEGAEKKFAEIQDFATRTPYDLAQVTDSFVKLVNFGLNPTDRAMTSYGNTASALGKDLNQMIEAVADAATGEFERLKEFGIKSKSEGDKVSFTFRGITTTVGKNAQEIEEYLIRLGETNFGDAMANRMSTLDGALSNLGDEWDKLFLNISQSGVGDAIADTVRVGISMLETLNEKIKSGELLEWVRAHKEVLITIGAVVTGVLALATGAAALAPVVYTLTAAWRGLNAVMLLTSGSQLLPWLGSVVGTLKGVQLAALGAAGALGAAAGASLALIGGYSLGGKIAEWEYFSDVVKGNKDALAEVPAKFAAISQATGVSIRSFEDLNKAQKEGLIRFNEATGAWEKVAKSAQDSADVQVKAQKAATDEMKKQYKEYADEVKRLQDDIAGREQSLAERLREMARSGMSDFSAWKDRKDEAEEYAVAAKRAAEESKKAFAAGDAVGGQSKAKEAVDLYDKAQAAAADLNREVKDGDTVIASQQQNLKTAMSMVEEYGRGAIDVQESLQTAIKESAQALDAQSGGQLSKELPEVAKQFGEIKEQADDLAGSAETFNKAWGNAWDRAVLGGKDAIAQLERELQDLTKDRHIKVYVEEVEKRSRGGVLGLMHGGLVQMLAAGGTVVRNIINGGFLPGFGGGDTVLLLGERGEVMINKYAVRAGGLRAALAFNAGQWDVVIEELLKRTGMNLHSILGYHLGGLVGSLPGVQGLAGGGSVEAAPGKSDAITLNLNFGNGRSITVTTSRRSAGELIREFRRAEVMSS